MINRRTFIASVGGLVGATLPLEAHARRGRRRRNRCFNYSKGCLESRRFTYKGVHLKFFHDGKDDAIRTKHSSGDLTVAIPREAEHKSAYCAEAIHNWYRNSDFYARAIVTVTDGRARLIIHHLEPGHDAFIANGDWHYPKGGKQILCLPKYLLPGDVVQVHYRIGVQIKPTSEDPEPSSTIESLMYWHCPIYGCHGRCG